MSIRLEIPNSVAEGIRLPESEAPKRLMLELATALYVQEILSFGKAAELADLDRFGFAKILGERKIPRHYTEEELEDDRKYAGH